MTVTSRHNLHQQPIERSTSEGVTGSNRDSGTGEVSHTTMKYVKPSSVSLSSCPNLTPVARVTRVFVATGLPAYHVLRHSSPLRPVLHRIATRIVLVRHPYLFAFSQSSIINLHFLLFLLGWGLSEINFDLESIIGFVNLYDVNQRGSSATHLQISERLSLKKVRRVPSYNL